MILRRNSLRFLQLKKSCRYYSDDIHALNYGNRYIQTNSEHVFMRKYTKNNLLPNDLKWILCIQELDVNTISFLSLTSYAVYFINKELHRRAYLSNSNEIKMI